MGSRKVTTPPLPLTEEELQWFRVLRTQIYAEYAPLYRVYRLLDAYEASQALVAYWQGTSERLGLANAADRTDLEASQARVVELERELAKERTASDRMADSLLGREEEALSRCTRLEAALRKIGVMRHRPCCCVETRKHPDRDFWLDGPCDCHVELAREALKEEP